VGTPRDNRDVDNTPNIDYMKLYSLQSIQYPTGGSTEFQYEANDFDEQASQINDQSYFSKQYSIVQQTDEILYVNDASPHWNNGRNTTDISALYVYTGNTLSTVHL